MIVVFTDCTKTFDTKGRTPVSFKESEVVKHRSDLQKHTVKIAFRKDDDEKGGNDPYKARDKALGLGVAPTREVEAGHSRKCFQFDLGGRKIEGIVCVSSHVTTDTPGLVEYKGVVGTVVAQDSLKLTQTINFSYQGDKIFVKVEDNADIATLKNSFFLIDLLLGGKR